MWYLDRALETRRCWTGKHGTLSLRLTPPALLVQRATQPLLRKPLAVPTSLPTPSSPRRPRGTRHPLALVTAWLVASLAVSPAWAQTPHAGSGLGVLVLPAAAGAAAGRPLYSSSQALVIGASAYQNGWGSLPGVLDDVPAVAATLKRQGFEVTVVLNPTRDQLDAALRNFISTRAQQPEGRVLVYFAGHGHTLTSAAGVKLGYIVPVDAPDPRRDPGGFKARALGMDSIEALAKQVDAKHALFVFDSCFSGTIFRTRAGVPDDISEATAKPVRQFITAGDEHQLVPDQSVFRRQFVAALDEGLADRNQDGFITGSELGLFLTETVTNYTHRTQTPVSGKIVNPNLDRGDFVFAAGRRPNAPSLAAPPGTSGLNLADLEQEDQRRRDWARWQASMQADFDRASAFAGAADLQAQVWQRFLSNWAADNPLSQQDDELRKLAKQRIQALIQAPALPPASAGAEHTGLPAPQAPTATEQTSIMPAVEREFRSYCVTSLDFCIELTRVPSRQQSTTISGQKAAFWIGRYEITQRQWFRVMGFNPSVFKGCGDTCPVDSVTWDEARDFTNKLSNLLDKSCRLPNDDEWTQTSAYHQASEANLSDFSWHLENSGNSTHPIGQKMADRLGIHDLYGNIQEWTENAPLQISQGTTQTGDKRPLRGGGWSTPASAIGAQHRIYQPKGQRSISAGLRVVCEH